MPEPNEGLDPNGELAKNALASGAELPKKEDRKEEGKPEQTKEPTQEGDFNFADLEEKAPKAFRGEIKKAHAWLTKKRQEDAEEKKKLAEKVAALEKTQLTEEVKKNFQQLQDFYSEVTTKPESVKGLIQAMKLTPEQLFGGEPPADQPDLTVDQLVTREDFANYAKQEIRKAVESVAKDNTTLRKELEDLKAFRGDTEAEKKTLYAFNKINEAARDLPGFVETVNGETRLTEDAVKACHAVRQGFYTGEEAIKNAWKALKSSDSQKKIEQALKTADEYKKKYEELQSNLRGAVPPPKQNSVATRNTKGGGDMWEELKKESLTPS